MAGHDCAQGRSGGACLAGTSEVSHGCGYARAVDLDTLAKLRSTHPAWRLLAADRAPFIVSFLHHAFVKTNQRTRARDDLVGALDDVLYVVRERMGDEAPPRTAAQYLDDWAGDANAWLRKFYPPGLDVPHYDLTPPAEKAIEFIVSLETRQFVATESRLLTVFELLRQIVEGTETDAEVRLAELERRRRELDAEIERAKRGDFAVMDSARVKDRFLQMSSIARGLLADFREVDQNFRDLDREVREQIAMWDGSKGKLLEDVFEDRDKIASSDQGKSFRAFWEFLMSSARRDELSERLEQAFALPAVQDLRPDPRLRRVHHDWADAGEATQRTVSRLSEQLRRYLDDKAWVENRRAMELIRRIEQHALALRSVPPPGTVAYLDESAPTIAVPMERALFRPPYRANLQSDVIHAGIDEGDADALYSQIYVDKARLAALVRRSLQSRSQITLAELLQAHPLSQGLAELVAWFSLAAEREAKTVFDESSETTIVWADAMGLARQATVPVVIFCR